MPCEDHNDASAMRPKTNGTNAGERVPSAEPEGVTARVVGAAVQGAIVGEVALRLERERLGVLLLVVRDSPARARPNEHRIANEGRVHEDVLTRRYP